MLITSESYDQASRNTLGHPSPSEIESNMAASAMIVTFAQVAHAPNIRYWGGHVTHG